MVGSPSRPWPQLTDDDLEALATMAHTMKTPRGATET